MSDSAAATGDHFSRQAERYAESLPHATDADLDIIAAFAEPGLYDFCLDVATGPGHTAMRLAPRAVLVVGIDIAGGMLATARRLAGESGHDNILFQHGDACAMPFADACFDLVTCRIAPHHFADIAGFVRETARVLKPGGRFIVEDSLAPEDAEAAAFLHRLEVRRDPTHVRSLNAAGWHEAIEGAGLAVTREATFHKQQNFRDWVLRAGLSEADADALEAELLAADPKLRETCLTVEDGRIAQLHDRKIILRAEKPDA